MDIYFRRRSSVYIHDSASSSQHLKGAQTTSYRHIIPLSSRLHHETETNKPPTTALSEPYGNFLVSIVFYSLLCSLMLLDYLAFTTLTISCFSEFASPTDQLFTFHFDDIQLLPGRHGCMQVRPGDLAQSCEPHFCTFCKHLAFLTAITTDHRFINWRTLVPQATITHPLFKRNGTYV